MRAARKAMSIGAVALVCIVAAGLALPVLGGKKKREKHVEEWSRVDLSGYSILYVEEFRMADEKADERKKVVQVKSAPKRLADYIQQTVSSDLFDVRRGTPEAPIKGAVILKGEITQYKPGSSFGRAMMAGAGSAHLDFLAHLVDAETGKELSELDGDRTWAWGGLYGMSKGVGDIEQNVAYEIALYLERCKTGKEPENRPPSSESAD